MAYQHFYSRVPARLSMYEKTDCFDTFAKSRDIDQKFIIDNLLPFCNIKLSAIELTQIRDGKFTTAYAQYFSKNGEKLIHSTISYIPIDYTGVRSSYMVHSLIFSDEEQNKIVSSTRNALFNSKLFCTNIDTFDITNHDGKPIENMSELLCSGEKADQLEDIVTKYEPEIIKRLIYAVLQSCTTKGKMVYITMEEPLETLSEAALNFMNSFVQIMPFSVRNKISFISFLCDQNRYNNIIKIKFIPSCYMNSTQNKALQFNLNKMIDSGLREEEYMLRNEEIEFMYSLFENKNLREKFLYFYDYLVEKNPKFNNFDLKEFANIILLFKQSCGEFLEKEVLPTDKEVYNIICVYEMYREYMKEKDRCEVLKCLQRYATSRIPIPQNIFSKVTKLYQTEISKCKTTVMTIILELILTDAMRDKLFNFIKVNYSKELPRNRSMICEELSKVFYGKFLQAQILNLFNHYYDTEVLQTKNLILEKLLLSIRTQDIQDKVLEFFSEHYDAFSFQQRDMIYNTFYEMLREDDVLSRKIIAFIDLHYEKDLDSYKNKIDNNIVSLCENDEKKKTRFLLNAILDNKGILEKKVLNKIFTIWSNKGSFNRYLESLETLNFQEIVDEIIKVWTYCYDMQTPVQKKFTEKILECLNNLKGIKLYSVIDFDDKLLDTIMNKDYRKLNTIMSLYWDNVDTFYSNVKTIFINNFVKEHLLDALNPKLKQDGVQYILDFASKNPFIKESDSYYLIVITSDVINSIKEGKNIDAFYRILNANLTRNVMKLILETLKIGLDDFEARTYTNEDLHSSSITIAGIYCYLENGYSDLTKLYDYAYGKRKDYLSVNRNVIRDFSKNEVDIESLASLWTIENICLYIKMFNQTSNNNENKENNYTDSEKGIIPVMYKVLEKLDKDGNKTLVRIISEIKIEDARLAEIMESIYNKYRKENKKGFFAKLFGKK